MEILNDFDMETAKIGAENAWFAGDTERSSEFGTGTAGQTKNGAGFGAGRGADTEFGAENGAWSGTGSGAGAKFEAEQNRELEMQAVKDAAEERVRRIRKEQSRLKKLFREIDAKSRAVVDGLIEQAAFLRVQLQDLSADIVENGTTELFAQGKDQEPYERQRPAANVYNSMNGNYQKIIKQLNELLPKSAPKTPVEDGFRDFVNGREDL